MSKENLSLLNSKLQPRGYIKKSTLTEEYYTVSKPAKPQNKNKARQVGSHDFAEATWNNNGGVCFLFILEIHSTLCVRSR